MILDTLVFDRHQVFCSRSPQDSHVAVAHAFCDHSLTWKSGKVDTVISRLNFERLELFSIQYGAEVEIYPQSFSDFVLLQISLQGMLDLEIGCTRQTSRVGQASFLGRQNSPFRMHWSPGSRQLVLKVPVSLLPE